MIGAATAVALVLATAVVQSLAERTIARAGWMVYALYALIIGAVALSAGSSSKSMPKRSTPFGVGLIGRCFDVADVRPAIASAPA